MCCVCVFEVFIIMSSSEKKENEEIVFKVHLLGEFGVGKSALIDKFIEIGTHGECVIGTGGESKLVTLTFGNVTARVWLVCE